MKKYLIVVSLLFVGTYVGEAQILKKLGKRAERAAERTVERRVDRETSKKTDEVLDSILEPGKKGKQRQPTGGSPLPENSSPDPEKENPGLDGQPQGGSTPVSLNNDPRMMKIYSKFDFVPGDKLLFFDDFGQEYVGDFPSRWNTNGSGEIVSINDETDKWFELKSGHSNYFIPDLPPLPEEYTIEFDLIANGLDRQTASTSVLKIILSDNDQFQLGNYALAQFSFCQYAPVGMRIRNKSGGINNEVGADIREAVLTQPRISIAVNKQRFRLWMNEKKYIDVPRLLPADQSLTALKFELLYFKDGKERLFIKNLKVAEGGLDLRQKLISEGRVSTNGILFDSGSANIQPQSMGIIGQISQVLLQESNMKLNIIGHTDSNGDEASNLELSK
jgi:flagellar motor protein MotB